jgi:fatty-acid desaturase
MWWEIDVAWITIRFLEIVGLVRDVRLPGQRLESSGSSTE